MKNILRYLITVLILTVSMAAYAEVTVGLLPLKGSDKNKKTIENEIKGILTQSGGLSIVDDRMMKDIIKVQEKAQSLGSAYHDISLLKSAEYLISGSLTSGRLSLTAVDVNKGTGIFTKQINIYTKDKGYRLRKICREIRTAILMHGASKQREVPEEAEAYMKILNNFVASLGSGKRASYRYIVFYHNGKYKRPVKGNKMLEDKAKLFVKVLKPNLIRSKMAYLFMKADPPWVYVNVISKKYGKKTRHTFGIIELEDGSLGIGIYKPMR